MHQMSSGGALPPQLNATFSPFSYLFPTQQPPPYGFGHQQRIKLKRQRQRVDAGEPRNSYQQPRAAAALATAASTKTEVSATSSSQVQPNMVVNELFPSLSWLTKDSVPEESPEGAKEEDEATDLRIPSVRDPEGEVNTNAQGNGEDKNDSEEQRASNASASSGSSSSRRKCFQPQKAQSDETDKAEGDSVDEKDDWEDVDKPESDEIEDNETVSNTISALQAQLNAVPETGGKLNIMLDAQKKFYATLMEQQKKLMESEKPRLQRELSNLAATLKNELLDCVSGQIDKIINEFLAETIKNNSNVNESRPLMMHPLYAAAFPNAASSSIIPPFPLPHTNTNGIFPPAFNPFNFGTLGSTPIKANEDENKRKRKHPSDVPSVRSKMTATASPVEGTGTPGGSERGSSPLMPRSTPLSNYFPASMVSQSIYGSSAFERDGSPADSDDISDCGPFDPNIAVSNTLTPMHLRKAKLMFFYTRYPNSTLLKTYFPDIRFNKNNTAQLVKWFSNFREFYYIQMEKFAKQAVAEGIRKKEDIVVTADSEIFKTLNQHYNRNNHIQAPDRLVWVVQETLREFFWAILHGKDAEPSWKKTIYKIINMLDDPIPDYFKDPNFLERLEQ